MTEKTTKTKTNNNQTVVKTTKKEETKQKEQTMQISSSKPKQHLMEVQKVNKNIINVNGKQYIDYDEAMYWLGLISFSADRENFYGEQIPAEAEDDETFDDTTFYSVQEEMEYWMTYLNMLIEDSLNPKYSLTTKGRNLLNNVRKHTYSMGLFDVFKKNRHVFDGSGMNNLIVRND